MSEVLLGTSYLDGGIADVDFFNGRVLAADDLRDQQAADLTRVRRVGRATGTGVVTGLDVSARATTTVTVGGGVAVTPRGDVLELAADVRVELVPPAGSAGSADSVFAACDPLAGTVRRLAGEGTYLLVMSAARQSRGRTPRVDHDTAGIATGCGPRYSVDGVCFRLVALDVEGLAAESGADAADLAVLRAAPGDGRRRLRNVLAHLLLGTHRAGGLVSDPWLPVTTALPVDPALAELRRDGRLGPDDVPLALMTWTGTGIEVLDAWAVRRRPVPGRRPGFFAVALTGAARAAVGDATFQQFHDQLAAMAAGPAGPMANLRALDHFRYFPAAGVIPSRERGAARGFDPQRFFEGIATHEPVTIPGARLEPLIRAATAAPPVDLTSGEFLFIYRIRENVETTGVQPYLVFTSGELRFEGGNPLEILAVFPAGPYHPGDQIEIRGHDFGYSAGLARVFFGSTREDPQPGSTDTRLLVTVPLSLTPPPTGEQVQLKVDKGDEEDTVTITVVPVPAAVAGRVDVLWSAGEPNPMVAGVAADHTFDVMTRLDGGATADVELSLKVRPLRLQQTAELRSTGGDPITSLPVMEAEESRPVVVHLPEVGVEPVTVIVTAKVGDIAGSDVRSFVPDEEQPPLEPVVVQLDSFAVEDGGRGFFDPGTTTVALEEGSTAGLQGVLTFTAEGTFDVSVGTSDATDGWATGLFQIPEQVVIDAGDLAGGPALRPFGVTVSAENGATPTGLLTFTIRRPGEEARRTKNIQLSTRI